MLVPWLFSDPSIICPLVLEFCVVLAFCSRFYKLPEDSELVKIGVSVETVGTILSSRFVVSSDELMVKLSDKSEPIMVVF